MLNFFMNVLARLMNTEQIATQERNDTAVFSDWSNVLMGCCDCGLMHRYDFWSNEEGDLLVRGRRDFAATRAVRRDKVFPFQPSSSTVPDPAVSRAIMIQLLSLHMDTIDAIASEFEHSEAQALAAVERTKARMRLPEFANQYTADQAVSAYFQTQATVAGRRAAAMRALIAEPKTPAQVEFFWNDIGRPEDPLFPIAISSLDRRRNPHDRRAPQNNVSSPGVHHQGTSTGSEDDQG